MINAEELIKYFSEEEEKEQELSEETKENAINKRKEAVKDLAIAGGSLAAAAGLNMIEPTLLKRAYKMVVTGGRASEAGSDEERKNLLAKLKSIGESKGIKTYNLDNFTNSAFVGGSDSNSGQELRDKIAKYDKFWRGDYDKDGKVNKYLIKIRDYIKKQPGLSDYEPSDILAMANGMSPKDFRKHIGKDHVIMGEEMKNNPGILGHELGHAHLGFKDRLEEGSKLDKIGHWAHNGGSYARALVGLNNVITPLASLGGFRRGKNAVSTDENGKIKINKKKLLKTAILDSLPTLATAPLLIQEGAASLHGLRNLKKLGASKEILNASKKDLADAFGSYAISTATPLIGGLSGHAIGTAYGIGREKLKTALKDRKKKKEDKNNE